MMMMMMMMMMMITIIEITLSPEAGNVNVEK